MKNDGDYEELTRLLAEDLEEHFPTVVERYTWRLRGYVYKSIRKDVPDREDVVNDRVAQTLIKAYFSLKGHIASGDEGQQWVRDLKLTAWLLTIAKHECMQYWQHTKRESHMQQIKDEEDDQFMTPTTNPWEQVDLRLDLRQALDTLPQRERMVLYWHFIEGWTYPDIVFKLRKFSINLNVNGVKALILRAKKKLRFNSGYLPFGEEE